MSPVVEGNGSKLLPLLKLGKTDSALNRLIPENWYRGAHIESRQRKQELPTVDPQ